MIGGCSSGEFKGIGVWKLPTGFVNGVSFSEDKKTSFTYLDCLWFEVLTWIQKDIISKKYVLVPIVCW